MSTRRLLQAALLWLGALRTFAGIGTVLASVWLVMAGVGILRQRGRGNDV